MSSELDQLTRLLHGVVAKINALRPDTRVHVFEMPAIDGAAVGTALWLPRPGVSPHAAPGYTVVSRENSVIRPEPCPQFERLLGANRAMLADVRDHADNVLVCTFDAPQPGGSLARTQFHVSQWPTRQAAGRWVRGSAEHAQVVQLAGTQPTVQFSPSVLASYELVKSKVPYRCPGCGRMAFGRESPDGACGSCDADPSSPVPAQICAFGYQ